MLHTTAAGPSGRAEQAAAGERPSGTDAASPLAAPRSETQRLLAGHPRESSVELGGQRSSAAPRWVTLLTAGPRCLKP